MAYLPVAPSSDDRSDRGAVPLKLTNMLLERAPRQSGKGAGWFLTQSSGFTRRVQLAGQNLRGLFCRPGVLSGSLFAVAGTTLYSISSSWVATSIGTIPGAGTVLMDALRNVLVIVADGKMYYYNGTSLTQVTDGDLSANLATLAILGQRVITSPANSDQLEWSAVLDVTAWPSDGFATSELQPDPIVANVVVGDELYSLGSSSTQIWRAIGGSDADAFDTFAGFLINKGCIARDSAVRVDAALFWLADDRCIYRASGADAQRIANRDLEATLAGLTEAQVAACIAYTFTDGSKVFYVLRPPVGDAYAFDVAEDVWSERATFGADAYRYAFTATAYDKQIVAGPDDDGIYSMERDVYDDGGDVLERRWMLHVPAPNNTRINSVGFDLKCFGQPLSGQGSDPEMMVTFYRDGGSISSITTGIERRPKLGLNGSWKVRPTEWRFGQIGSDGFLLEHRITDPVGVAAYGVWINEGRV